MGILTELAQWWVHMIDFPALILLVIFTLGAWVLWRTQVNEKNNFDFADMLRDDTGKPSAFRLGLFVCLGVSTWAIMYILITKKGDIDTWVFVSYMAIWSGAKVADKLVDAYGGRTASPPNAATRNGAPATMSQSQYPRYAPQPQPQQGVGQGVGQTKADPDAIDAPIPRAQ